MHSARRALVQSNRGIGLVNLMQIGGASAKDPGWCTRNKVETSSDLRCMSAAHTSEGGDVGAPVEGITKTTIGDCGLDPTGKETFTPGCVKKSLQKQGKPRLRLPSKRQLATDEPATVSRDEQLRMEAAAAVVDLSWPWAPLSHGLGRDVHEAMPTKRRTEQTKALATAFEANLMHGSVEVWRQLKAWFQAQHVTIPGQMWPAVFVEDFLQYVNKKAGGATALATYYRLSGWPAGPGRHLASKMCSPQSLQRKVKLRAPKTSTRVSHGMELLDDFDRRLEARDMPSYRTQLQWSVPSRPSGMHTPVGQYHYDANEHRQYSGLPRQKQ